MNAKDTSAMKPEERLPFKAFPDREKLTLPDGARMIVWPVLALEVWDIDRPMPRMVLSPPQGQALQPDVPNWTWHEYGMRVGLWRLIDILESFDIKPCVTLNARVCEDFPEVAQKLADKSWEFNAHSYDQIAMHKLDDQQAVINRSCDIIEKFTGKRPRGWFGPGLTQTFDTMDYLAEAGIQYIGDWVLDDLPVEVQTRHGEVIALPYNYEIHDIAQQAIQQAASEQFFTRGRDYFDCLYQESANNVKIMSVAIHPYLSGSPHRARYIRELFEHITGHDGVKIWDGEQILDWYLSTRGKA